MASAAVTRTGLQGLLPACQRCRRLRRRCDTQLPTCRRCESANADCTFVDPATGDIVERSYVQSLLTRLDSLKEAERCHSGRPATNDAAWTTFGAAQSRQEHQAQGHCPAVVDGRPPQLYGNGVTAPHSFDAIILSSSPVAGDARYWGASSVIALVVEVFRSASVAGFLDTSTHLSYSDNAENILEASSQVDKLATTGLTSEEAASVKMLVDKYISSTNTLYSIVDPADARIWLSDYLNLVNLREFDPANLNAEQSRVCFCVNMMCAVACAAQSRHHPSQTIESLRYYRSAILYIETATSTISFPSLQALMLLIVFCLFQPAKGDVWKLLDHACHLAIELCYHRETEQDLFDNKGSAGSATTVQSLPLRRTLFWSLYAIEVTAAQVCGRSSALPEFIISTKYPDERVSRYNDSFVGFQPLETTPLMEPVSHTLKLLGCHSRLMTIRSQAFHIIYLSANETRDGSIHDVLAGQYDRLLSWQQEYHALVGQGIDEAAISLACEIGYDATVCSIFQGFIMRRLQKANGGLTNEQPLDAGAQSSGVLFLVECYNAATRLVRLYERILDSAEDCARGAYPITFIDSNYMFMAAAVFIAIALLALQEDTTTKTSTTGQAPHESNTFSGKIDWNAFIDMSISCPRLLTWCTERWPSMRSMLKPYKSLYVGLLRELIAHGFIS